MKAQKQRVLFLVVAAVLIVLSVFTVKQHSEPTEFFMEGETMADGSVRYEDDRGSVAIVKEWKPEE